MIMVARVVARAIRFWQVHRDGFDMNNYFVSVEVLFFSSFDFVHALGPCGLRCILPWVDVFVDSLFVIAILCLYFRCSYRFWKVGLAMFLAFITGARRIALPCTCWWMLLNGFSVSIVAGFVICMVCLRRCRPAFCDVSLTLFVFVGLRLQAGHCDILSQLSTCSK